MRTIYERHLAIPAAGVQLQGDLVLPSDARAIIIFAHGSGSNRLSPRNKMVADYLVQHGYGTLLFDLLTEAEEQVYENRFGIDLLSFRLVRATEWLEDQLEDNYSIGYFGASTGAAAALLAATALQQVSTVVSRGGRPDLAMDMLTDVRAATLLIVGSLDTYVLQLNQKSLAQLNSPKKIEIIPGASHLFEEPGTMEKVCIAAADWFQHYLQPVKAFNS